MNNRQTKLLSCSSPEILFLSGNVMNPIETIVMGDFNGVDCSIDSTKQAILDFSYNLSVGNMDLAFKAVNSVSRY